MLLQDSRVGHVLAVVGEDPTHYPVSSGDPERLSVYRVDMEKDRRVRNLLFGAAREHRIHTIAHLAQHRSAWAEGSRVHAFNVDALRAILELAERHPTIRRLVLRSDAAVYQVQRDLPVLIGEDHPLNLHGDSPQWIRDRVEADVMACARTGMGPLEIAVLRMTELLAPGTGSQLYDYLESPVCLRPAGYDPMMNVLTIEDAASALQKAIHSSAQGVFNIPGADTLPLTTCIRAWGRLGLPIPGSWMTPLYRLRRRFTGHDFRYGMNRRRFHYSGVLDGSRAREVLRYVPSQPVAWPGATVGEADRESGE
jgi:UDP-glucose 4-epimerase